MRHKTPRRRHAGVKPKIVNEMLELVDAFGNGIVEFGEDVGSFKKIGQLRKEDSREKIGRINPRFDDPEGRGDAKSQNNINRSFDGYPAVAFVFTGHHVPVGDFVHQKMRSQNQRQADDGTSDFGGNGGGYNRVRGERHNRVHSSIARLVKDCQLC